MRLYRGLTKEGKWVYGWFIEREGSTIADGWHSYIIPDYRLDPRVKSVGIVESMIAVIPETVGQSIGLHDKNGKEIYEGDIILYPWASGTFSKGYIEYKTYTYTSPKYMCITADDDENGEEISFDSRCEVIGNTHENPDLLKEDKE